MNRTWKPPSLGTLGAFAVSLREGTHILFWSCFKFWIAIPYGTFFQRHSSNTEVFAWKTSRTIKVRWNFPQKKPHLGWNRLMEYHLILPTWNAGSCIVVHSQAVFISPLLLILHVSWKLCVCKFLPQRFFTKVGHQDVHIAMQSKLLLSQLTTVTRIQHPIKCHPESHPSTQPIPAFVFSEFPYPQVVAGPFDPTLRSMAVPLTRLWTPRCSWPEQIHQPSSNLSQGFPSEKSRQLGL